MKKILLVALLITSFDSRSDGSWVAPLVGGVIIGGVIWSVARPQYAPPPIYYGNPYSNPGYGYHYETMFDPYCQCYKTVLVPNY